MRRCRLHPVPALAVALAVIAAPTPAPAQSAPAGWTTTPVNSPGAVAYTPPDLNPGEV